MKPDHGLRFVLERASSEHTLAHYRGAIETPNHSVPIEITVREDDTTPDGLGVEPRLGESGPPEWDEQKRATLLRQAGIMARSAVRGARKDGLPPPRRIQRWRDL